MWDPSLAPISPAAALQAFIVEPAPTREFEEATERAQASRAIVVLADAQAVLEVLDRLSQSLLLAFRIESVDGV